MIAALIGMCVFMADRTSAFQFAFQVGTNSVACASTGTNDRFDLAFIENLHGAAAHASGNDHFHAAFPCTDSESMRRLRSPEVRRS